MSLFLHRAGVMAGPRYSAAASDYFARLDAVSGRVTAYDRANANLIDALVALGGAYWDTAGTITTLCAKAFAGITVPLRDGMSAGTSYNFVSGDLNVKTGLKGNGTNKYIGANRNNNADGQNDNSNSIWITEVNTADVSFVGFMGCGAASNGSNFIGAETTTLNYSLRSRTLTGSSVSYSTGGPRTGFHGIARTGSANYVYKFDDLTATLTVTSQTPFNGDVLVFARGNASNVPGLFSDARMSCYHIGPAVTMTTLEGILSTFMTEVDAV
jgi:hypothetical protein